MRKALHNFLIPHEGNGYHPHALHPKRAIFYGLFLITLKILIITFVVLLPQEVFVLPDVLKAEAEKVFSLTNELRKSKGLNEYKPEIKLYNSASYKALDMAENEYFSHTSPSGKSLSNFLNRSGYSYSFAGENLAMGFSNAESAIAAWVNSPSHYSNIIDKDFNDLGIGIENGKYAGENTVFLVQHFGTPSEMVKPTAVQSKPKIIAVPKKMVLAEKTENIQVEPAKYFRERSNIYWFESPNGTILKVRAEIEGEVREAFVDVYGSRIYLTSSGTAFIGETFVPLFSSVLFNPVIIPSITIEEKTGSKIVDYIDWYNVKVPEYNVVQNYIKANEKLSPITNIFTVSKNIYLAFFIFFSWVLALTIFIEIRKQHYHIIFQTVCLLVLTFWLWYI